MPKFKLTSKRKSKDGELLSQIVKGNARKVYKLILQGADVNKEDALHMAVSIFHPDIVALMLDKGANPEKGNNDHETPLHIAAQSDNPKVDIMKLLIEKGANVDSRNKAHETPLHRAVLKERIDHIELLLSADADVNAQNSEGKTALDYAENENIRDLLNKHIQEKKAIIKVNDFKPKLTSNLITDPFI